MEPKSTHKSGEEPLGKLIGNTIGNTKRAEAMLIRMKYLYQKTPNGVFYFKRRLPTDLVDKVGKKVELISLKTHDTLKAQVKAKSIAKDLELEWSKLRVTEEVRKRGSFKGARELLNSFEVGVLKDDLGDFGQEKLLESLMDKQPQSLLKEHEESHSTLDDPEVIE